MGWQADLFERLRDREWHQLGELFEALQDRIPLHHAMRHCMHPTLGRTELPANSEARWRLFLQVIACIGIESDGAKTRRKYADHVRLRYVADKTCNHCGGPVIRAGWSGRSTVACLACEARTAPLKAPAVPLDRGAVTGSPPPATETPPVQTVIVPLPMGGVTVARVVKTTDGWKWRARKGLAEFVKTSRLPFLTVSRILREWDRAGNLTKFLQSRGKRPITQQEYNQWAANYVQHHPP